MRFKDRTDVLVLALPRGGVPVRNSLPDAQEDAVKRLDLSLPEFGFIVVTRAALGAGIGLLAAGKIRFRNRRRLGAALVAVGVLTTIPAALLLFRELGPAGGPHGTRVQQTGT